MRMRPEFSGNRLSYAIGLGACVCTFCLTVDSAHAQTSAIPTAPSGVSGVATPITNAPNIGDPLTQAENPKPAWYVVPRMTVIETFTNNVGASSASTQSDRITELAPGIRLQGETARLKMFADYSLRGFYYANNAQLNKLRNTLNSFGTVELVDKAVYVDFTGVISQQTVSAFRAQGAGAENASNNIVESSTYRISPYVRGKVGPYADYEVRATHIETRSGVAGSVTNDQLLAKLAGPKVGMGFGWSGEASRQSISYATGRHTEADRLIANLSYKFDSDWKATASVGYESNDYSTANKEARTTFGYGGDWTPSERTNLSVFREHRFFGQGHRITFNHRMPRAALRFLDTKDVYVLPTQGAQSGESGMGTYYDLYSSQLAATVPDPVARDQQVTALLQQAGISPTAAIAGGFLSTRATVRRRQDLSLILNGSRNTVTYTLFRTMQQSISASQSLIADDFATSSTIITRGMSSNLSHQLSAVTSLNALSSWSRNEGSGSGLSVTTRRVNFSVTHKLGPHLRGTLGLRAVRSEGGLSPFNENAFLGTILALF